MSGRSVSAAAERPAIVAVTLGERAAVQFTERVALGMRAGSIGVWWSLEMAPAGGLRHRGLA